MSASWTKMRLILSGWLLLAAALPAVAPASAGTFDDSACRRDLTRASTVVSETMAGIERLPRIRGEERCAAYRRQFFEAVKAREVVTVCANGPDRDRSISRLDGAIETINSGIAEGCAIE